MWISRRLMISSVFGLEIVLIKTFIKVELQKNNISNEEF